MVKTVLKCLSFLKNEDSKIVLEDKLSKMVLWKTILESSFFIKKIEDPKTIFQKIVLECFFKKIKKF